MREHSQRAQGGLGDDVVSVVVEAALRACWLLVRAAWSLAVWVVRHPVAAVVVALPHQRGPIALLASRRLAHREVSRTAPHVACRTKAPQQDSYSPVAYGSR